MNLIIALIQYTSWEENANIENASDMVIILDNAIVRNKCMSIVTGFALSSKTAFSELCKAS
jgi:hypothetical protein